MAIIEKIQVGGSTYDIGVLATNINGTIPANNLPTIPASKLPSYVDDVIEGDLDSGIFYETKAEDGTYSNQITGESGKIYIDLNENKTYRWSGTVFAIVSETLALGETSTTAYQGDKGKIAYDHSQITNGNPHGITKSTIGLDNVENKSSSTILSELTQNNVTTALGYVPSMSDLSNVDNTTFKAKVEASGFSSGTQVQILTWEETD